MKIGLNEAIVVQQLHYLLRNPRFGKRIAEQQWIFNTYEEWRTGFFPFWSSETIKRTFTSLSKLGMVIWCQPEGRLSRRKYYRLDYAKLSELSEQVNLTSSNGSNCAVPITKTTYKESKESEETSADADALSSSEYQPLWKPDTDSKEQKLRRIRTPKEYPSEREFDAFMAQNCSSVNDVRPGLYSELCDQKWHQWDKTYQKWIRIRNWKSFVSALETKVTEAYG